MLPKPPKYREQEISVLPDYSVEGKKVAIDAAGRRRKKVISLNFGHGYLDYAFGIGDVVHGCIEICSRDEDGLQFQGIGVDLVLYESNMSRVLYKRAITNHVIPLETYPTNRKFEYGYVYNFPFSFLLVDTNQDESASLPPTFISECHQIVYYIRARLIKKDNSIIEAKEDITVMVPNDNRSSSKLDFHTTKKLQTGGTILRKREYGNIQLNIPGPIGLPVTSATSSTVDLYIQFSPSNGSRAPPPPQVKSIIYKLRSKTNTTSSVLLQRKLDVSKLQWNIPAEDGHYETSASIPITLDFADPRYTPNFSTKTVILAYSVEVILLTNFSPISLTVPADVHLGPLTIRQIPRRRPQATSRHGNICLAGSADPFLLSLAYDR